MLPSSKFFRIVFTIEVTMVALLILGAIGTLNFAKTQFFSDLVQSAVALLAGLCVLHAAKRFSGFRRRLWLLFASGIFVTFVAQALVTYFNNISHRLAVTPWPSDILFILWVLPILMMLLPQTVEESDGTDWLAALDLVQIGIVALTAYVYFYYVASLWQAEGHQMVVNVMRLQGYRDAVIAATFLAASRSVTSPSVKALYGRVSVFFFLEIGPTLFYLSNWQTTTPKATWSGVTWCIPYLILTVIAGPWIVEDSKGTEEPSAPFKNTIVSQILPVCIPLLVLFMGRQIAREQNTIAWVAITVAFCVSATRLVLTNEKQRRIADDLRKTVRDRRSAEEALRVSEERFRSLVQEMHVGIVLLGPNAEARYVNRAALDIFCLNEDQAFGKSPFDLELTAVREDERKIPVSEWPGLRAITMKIPVLNEVIGWQGPGLDETVWTLVDALPQLTQQGEVANVVLTISNITELKRAQEALQTSEELFRTLVESMSICVILLDPAAKVVFANQAALQLFGRTLESVVGKTSQELGVVALREDGTEIPFEMRPGPQTIATGKPVRNQLIGWRDRATSEVVWTTSEVIPVFDKNGKLEKLVGTLTDITKLKEAEETMHQLSMRLLRLQDEERRRLGRELHDSLAQSVMAVSLDLAQIARSSVPLDKAAKHSLSQARGVLRDMSREIRTLSYLLHPPVLDELGLVSAVKEYAHGFSERSGIALELEIQRDFARISQEAETALFRIVQESLSNIQRHSGSLTGMIRLKSEDGRIELEVSDAGCGISKDTHRDSGSKEKAPRLGVGILGMRERMAQLRGTLEVLSSPSGTTVKATIPLTLGMNDAAPSNTRG